MPRDLELSCRCGAFRGRVRDVTPDAVNSMICYCDDCQTFAHALGRGDVLDERGGTHVVQFSPALLELGEGAEHLACLRLTERGLVRWYTTCCQSPVANMLASPRPPFVGLSRALVARTSDGSPVEEAIGPIRARVQPRWAKGDRATLQADAFPVRVLLRTGGLMLRWWLAGDARRSPLRDEHGAPRVPPRVLPTEELRDARRRAGF